MRAFGFVVVLAAIAGTATAKGGAGSVHGVNAERLARAESCSAEPAARLVAKGPGFKSYTVACANGDALMIRCDLGQCRVMR